MTRPRRSQLSRPLTLGRRLALYASMVVAALSAAGPALANGPGVIVKVHPASGQISPYFRLSAPAGSLASAGSLELVNPSGRSELVRLDPVDAITTDTLGSAYAMQDAGVHGTTTWLRIGQRVVTLAPHADTAVNVSVNVPTGTHPGDYLSGVAVQVQGQEQTAKVTRGVAIGQVERYAIGVELTVPGPRHPAVRLTGAAVTREPSGLAFMVFGRNTGNVILKNVHGWILVTSGSRRVAAVTVAPGTFVTATGISYPVPAWHEQPVPGARYRVRAAFYYHGGVARLDTYVTFSHAAAVTQENYGGRKLPRPASPWVWVAAAVAILLGGFALRLFLRRRRRPLSRAAGLKLLGSLLAGAGQTPVSIVLIHAPDVPAATVARTVKPRLRRSDRVCDLRSEGVLVIAPATGRRAASGLREDLLSQLWRDVRVAGTEFYASASTATKAIAADELLDRAMRSCARTRNKRGRGPEPVGAER